VTVTDDEKKNPIDHTLDVFVYLPLGFVLDFPQSIPRYIDRGRRELSPSRLLARGGRNGLPSLSDAGAKLSRLQEHTQSTLRALGVTIPGVADATSASNGNGRSSSNGRGPVATAASAAADAATASSAPAEGEGQVVHEAPAVPVAPAADPSTLGITDYDSLSASQVVPRLDSLAPDELEGIRAYEAATRGRKTILNKIAQIQTA
jgi:hypothetical protein